MIKPCYFHWHNFDVLLRWLATIVTSIPVLTASLAIWTAIFDKLEIFSAVLMASFTSSSAGNTLLTRPKGEALHQYPGDLDRKTILCACGLKWEVWSKCQIWRIRTNREVKNISHIMVSQFFFPVNNLFKAFNLLRQALKIGLVKKKKKYRWKQGGKTCISLYPMPFPIFAFLPS